MQRRHQFWSLRSARDRIGLPHRRTPARAKTRREASRSRERTSAKRRTPTLNPPHAPSHADSRTGGSRPLLTSRRAGNSTRSCARSDRRQSTGYAVRTYNHDRGKGGEPRRVARRTATNQTSSTCTRTRVGTPDRRRQRRSAPAWSSHQHTVHCDCSSGEKEVSEATCAAAKWADRSLRTVPKIKTTSTLNQRPTNAAFIVRVGVETRRATPLGPDPRSKHESEPTERLAGKPDACSSWATLKPETKSVEKGRGNRTIGWADQPGRWANLGGRRKVARTSGGSRQEREREP